MLKKTSIEFWLLGILFAFFWSSASPAAKIGVQYADPLTLFQIRFFAAGLIMLLYLKISGQWHFPKKEEWLPLSIFGILNITLYLSLFVFAVKEIAAGIGSMATSLCPILIAFLGQILLGKKVKWLHFVALCIGFLGVGLAVWPLLQNSYATPKGLILLFLSMLSYSFGTLYFTGRTWVMNRLQINAWQVLLGGVFLLPFTLYFQTKPIVFNCSFILSEFWLIFPVSILAVNLWLRLISIDATKAAMFMFLCPIFGFMIASFFLKEPFTYHTFLGTVLVVIALVLGQRK
jgi:probable blue pigment (indigoidine) exporter